MQEESAWREVKYSKKISHALRGLRVFWAITKTMHSVAYIIAIALSVFLGFYFCISSIEWIAIVFAVGLVLISEAFNTAIEIDIDLTSPEYHPYARDTKDVAAAAVLLSCVVASLVGMIVFVPKFLFYVNM